MRHSSISSEKEKEKKKMVDTQAYIYPSNEYVSQLFLRRNLLRVIVTLVIVVDILLQVVVGVGLLKVLAEGSISRVSSTMPVLHNQKVSDNLDRRERRLINFYRVKR